MAKRQVVMSEIGGVMIAVGIIWFGLSGFKPGWGGITDLLPTWLLQPAGGLLLAVAGALLVGLSRDALTGPDVWRGRHLNKGTFLSDRLVQALLQAKLDHWFELVRCRVV